MAYCLLNGCFCSIVSVESDYVHIKVKLDGVEYYLLSDWPYLITF
jgi:hypothetical protein